MSIIVKELLPSDSLSEALIKINDNFNQIILSGGGPPGPPGTQGTQGIAGPKGDDGTHWFTGATTPSSPLNGDFWLKTDGTVWKYSSLTSMWSDTGLNLKGAQGPIGSAGSAMEIKMYKGRTGGSLIGSNDSWTIDSTSTMISDDSRVNFIVPTGGGKNSLFIGDSSLPFNKFINWNNLDIIKGTVPPIRMTPKLTLIQNEMDYTGYGGLTIGAKGATSNAVTSSSPSTDPSIIGSITQNINTRDFFNAGYYIKQPRNLLNPYIDESGKYTHGFLMSMYTMDLDIQSGSSVTSPSLFTNLSNSKIPSINLKSYRIHLEDFERIRSIYSDQIVSGTDLISFVQLNSKPSQTNPFGTVPANGKTFGYVGLQNIPGIAPSNLFAHSFGTVVIGSTGSGTYKISNNNTSALNIGRPIPNHYDANFAQTTDSHITLWQGNESTDTTFTARIVGANPSNYLGGSGYLQIQSRALSIVPKLSTTTGGGTAFAAKFPLHVIQLTANGQTSLPSYSDGTTQTGAFTDGRIHSVLAGFESINLQGRASAALGIVNYRHSSNTWSAGSTADGVIPTSIGLSTWWTGKSTQTGAERWDANTNGNNGKNNPDLYLQPGLENVYGNVGIGFISNPTASSQGTNIGAWSKLSVVGSVTISSIANSTYNTGWADRFPGSLTIQGPIVRGSHTIANVFIPPTNSFLTNWGMTGSAYYTPTGSVNWDWYRTSAIQYLSSHSSHTLNTITSNRIGIVSLAETISGGFVSMDRQLIASSSLNGTFYKVNPSYSLADFRTGMDMQNLAEGLLVVNQDKNYVRTPFGGTARNSSVPNLTGDSVPAATTYAHLQSKTAAKFSNRTDYTGLTGVGFQVTERFATQSRTLTTNDLEGSFIKPYYGAYKRYNSTIPGKWVENSWEGFVLTIPTTHSLIVMDLAFLIGEANKPIPVPYNRFLPHTYNTSSPLVQTSPGVTGNYPTIESWKPPTVIKQGGTAPISLGLRNIDRGISTRQYLVDPSINRSENYTNLPSNLLVTLQPGIYDGQEVTLYISRCSSLNEVVLTGNPVPFSVNQPWLLDDNSPTVTNEVQRIWGVTRINMAYDIDESINPFSAETVQMPYPVPRSAIKTFAGGTYSNTSDEHFNFWRLSTNWSWPLNNTYQAIAANTGTPSTRNGDFRVTPIQTSLGSFRFRTGRLIKFKWCQVYSSRVDSSGIPPSTSTDKIVRYSNTGSTSVATGWTDNGPIPNLTNTQEYYETKQTAPSIGPGGNAMKNFAWVEVSRSYLNQSPWTSIDIPKIPV